MIEAQLDYEWSRFLQRSITQEDFVSAADMARQYGLRGADALHLAIAREMNEDLGAAGDDLVFWTADRELVEAARKTGLQVQNPLDPVG